MNFKVLKLKKQLKDQGRKVSWLADQMGLSRGYVYNVLRGDSPWTESFQVAALSVLGEDALSTDLFRGQVVKIPVNFYQKVMTPEFRGAFLERSWKESWVKEHGTEILAIEAERAWQIASALNVRPQ